MRRTIRSRLASLVGFASVSAATLAIAEGRASADTWTVLTYVYADNNLEREAIFNINQMMKVGTTGNVKVAVQLNRGLKYSQDALPGVANFKGTKRLRIDPGTAVEIQDLGNIDNTQPAAIADFIKWGVQTYPSDHYAFVLWDHGSGWKGCCEDEGSPGRDWTPLGDMVTGIQTGLSGAGKTKFDLLGFDECLMGSIEVAQAMQPYARVMVGSAETEPGEGWNYEPFLRSITGNPAIDPIGVGKAITDGYKAQNSSDDEVTFSVVDLEKIPALVSAVDALSDAAGPPAAVRETWLPMAKSRAKAEKYAYSGASDPLSAVDLGNFISGIQGPSVYQPNVDAAASAYAAAVVYHVEGAAHAKHTGLSIHLPQKGANPEYLGISYAQTHWPQFIANYSLGSGSDPNPPNLDDPHVTPASSSSSSSSSSGSTSSSSSSSGSASSSSGGSSLPTIFGPINLGTLSHDDDLDVANLFLSSTGADGSQKFMGALPATMNSDGTITAPFDGRWPQLTDGTTDGIAPFFQVGTFTSRGGGANVMLAMVGDIIDSAGSTNPGIVLFRYDPSTRSADVMRAYTFDLSRGFGQFDITKDGAKVRPWDLTVQALGFPTVNTGAKVYDGSKLALQTKALVKGQYAPGFLVTDLAGNVSTKQTAVLVDVPQDATSSGGTSPNGNATAGSTDTRAGCDVTGPAPGGNATLAGIVAAGLAIALARRKKKS